MTKVFITGATGNVGREVLSALQKIDYQLDLYAVVRDINADKRAFGVEEGAGYKSFECTSTVLVGKP